MSTVHIRIVVSSDAEARKTPSEDQAMSDKPFECPVKFLTSCPVCGDQIFTSLSPAGFQVHENKDLFQKLLIQMSRGFRKHAQHEASSVPSGLNLTAEIDWVCPDIV